MVGSRLLIIVLFLTKTWFHSKKISVHRIRPLIQDVIGCENTDHIPMSDHSILSWTYFLTNTKTISVTNENEPGEDPRKFTVYNRNNIPSTFLADPETLSKINYKIEDLQASQNTPSNIDEVYSDFCDKMKQKIDALTDTK